MKKKCRKQNLTQFFDVNLYRHQESGLKKFILFARKFKNKTKTGEKKHRTFCLKMRREERLNFAHPREPQIFLQNITVGINNSEN